MMFIRAWLMGNGRPPVCIASRRGLRRHAPARKVADLPGRPDRFGGRGAGRVTMHENWIDDPGIHAVAGVPGLARGLQRFSVLVAVSRVRCL